MVYTAFLIVHIIAGTIGLLTGPLAIVVKKGGWAHRKSGIVFFYTMLVVAATALVLGTLHHIPFLIAVGVFSAYMNLTGYRVLYQKQRGRVHQTNKLDRSISLIMLGCSLYFLLYGIYVLFMKDMFGLVFVFFAQGSLRMLWQDWKLFQQKDLEQNTWLKIHLTRMIGTCIAAYTAFSVVNSSSRVSLVGWFLPALIGIPILIYWSRKVKIRKEKAATEVMA